MDRKNAMRRLLIFPLLLLAFLPIRAHAVGCTDVTNGTVQTQSYLLTQEFQDGRPAGSITPGCMRDLIATLGQGNIGIEIDFFMAGTPAASAVLVKTFSRQTVVPASPGIQCTAVTGATASTTVTLSHEVSGTLTSVGTAVFAASGSAYQSCTATWTTLVTFAAGDSLVATFPATPDATAANISISIPALQ
jgi:hypothetical protein